MSHRHRRAVLLPVVLASVTVVVTACGPTTTAARPHSAEEAPTPAGPVSAAATASCHYRGALPDPACTPGAFDPKTTQDTIKTTICTPGWSKQARPPVTVTEPIKKERVRAYGVTSPLSTVELDHLGPVSLGGLTNSANLWPENWDGPEGAHVKDVLEVKVLSMVCDGTIPVKDAQQAIVTDWVAAYRRYVGPL